jgi:DNA topoisomerase-1
MSNYLVIVESPAKARTIEKYLGKQYTVKASMGHLRDLPKSQLGVDIEAGFVPKYITIRGKGGLLKELKTAAKKAKRVYLATDPDREGEAISWHLANSLDVNPHGACRVTFNEITKSAIQKAFKQPRSIDDSLVNAQQARRILDRIVGYKLSPLLWQKVRKGLSAGRVQSVAVKMIADRDREILAFKPVEYWSLHTTLTTAQGQPFEAKLVGVELPDEATVNRHLDLLRAASFSVQTVKKAQRERKPAAPFITSTLQQEASRKLGFAAKRTMRIAQSLYEGVELGKEGAVGLVTYMRTDSTRISEEALSAAEAYIVQTYGKEYHVRRQYSGKGNAQNAHEAIRPSYIERLPGKVKEFLSRDQYRLYKLIYDRFLASQMANALFDTVTVDIGAAGLTLRATGSKLVFPGFMSLYIEGSDDEEVEGALELPELSEGQRLTLSRLTPKQHFTEPPPRFTEASLIKALEEKGIGRPSTYAPIIDTIQGRGYVAKEQKRFYATELGFIVTDILADYFPEIVNVQFTAQMEGELDRIESAQVSMEHVLQSFYASFEEKLAHALTGLEKVEIEDEVTDEVCELCGRNMVIKSGRFGKFLACPGFPSCRNTKPILKETGVLCPTCGGSVVERRSKRGRVFYGCANYPQCTFVVWNKPTDKSCGKCGSFLMEKSNRNGESELLCANPQCGKEQAEGEAQ